jgi:hypothetical protein
VSPDRNVALRSSAHRRSSTVRIAPERELVRIGWGASWFPDGRRICYSHEDRLYIRDLAAGAERQLESPIKGRQVRTPAVSPDGGRVIFQVVHSGAWLLDVQHGTMMRVLEDPTRKSSHGRRTAAWRFTAVATASGESG